MKIYILTFDDYRLERASCDGKKIQQMADECNGYDEMGNALFGPYSCVEMELEDIPKEQDS